MPDKWKERTIKTADGKKFKCTIAFSDKKDADELVNKMSKMTYKEIKKMFNS